MAAIIMATVVILTLGLLPSVEERDSLPVGIVYMLVLTADVLGLIYALVRWLGDPDRGVAEQLGNALSGHMLLVVMPILVPVALVLLALVVRGAIWLLVQATLARYIILDRMASR